MIFKMHTGFFGTTTEFSAWKLAHVVGGLLLADGTLDESKQKLADKLTVSLAYFKTSYITKAAKLRLPSNTLEYLQNC